MAGISTLAGGNDLRLVDDGFNEAHCVAAAKRGDASGFAQLYGRYLPRLFGRARCKWRLSNEVAEDVVHDAWVRVIEHIGSFDAQRPFEPWAFRILDNVVIDHLRRTRTGDGKVRHLSVAVADVIDELPPERAQDDERVADREALTKAMAALPARQQQTAVGVLVSGLTLDEAAAQLQLTNTACRQLLHRARTSLRRILIEQGALPVLVPSLFGLRRRFAALSRRLGLTEGNALAGSGSTVVAVMLSVTVSVAVADVAIARSRPETTASAPAVTVVADAPDADADARRELAQRPAGRSRAAGRPAASLRAAGSTASGRSVLVAVPSASVPVTGNRVHQQAPEDPDFDYGVEVRAAGVRAGVTVQAERHENTAPVHAAACDAAGLLPSGHCNRETGD